MRILIHIEIRILHVLKSGDPDFTPRPSTHAISGGFNELKVRSSDDEYLSTCVLKYVLKYISST